MHLAAGLDSHRVSGLGDEGAAGGGADGFVERAGRVEDGVAEIGRVLRGERATEVALEEGDTARTEERTGLGRGTEAEAAIARGAHRVGAGSHGRVLGRDVARGTPEGQETAVLETGAVDDVVLALAADGTRQHDASITPTFVRLRTHAASPRSSVPFSMANLTARILVMASPLC
jgi:hypothetical protein